MTTPLMSLSLWRMVQLKSDAEITQMLPACRAAAATLNMIEQHIRPGITTDDINDLVHEDTIRRGGIPAPLNYHGFPKSVCTSVNHVVCHGIPGNKRLKDGDIINIDVTTIIDGWHGDTSRTFHVGTATPKGTKIVEVARQALQIGINAAHPGGTLGDIGHAIQQFSEAQGCTIVKEYCGHGTGRNFHEDPQVLHYGQPNCGLRLEPGLVFTIEPMINLGRAAIKLLGDKWTVVTRDKSLSAQFEHTLAVTDNGVKILTLADSQEI
ncbi:MAG: type I methionyl aminopeptidase [Mariprofundales bacterium]